MKDIVTIKKIAERQCPYCNHKGNHADAADFTGDGVCYPYTCEKCGRNYEELYTLTFFGMNVGVNCRYSIEETGAIDPVTFDYEEE